MALKPAESLTMDVPTKANGEPDFSDLLSPDVKVKGSEADNDTVPF
jgi:hypothetical protein